MFRRYRQGWQHSVTLLRALAVGAKRDLLWHMFTFSRNLPQRFNQPLPTMMAQLTSPGRAGTALSPDDIRQMADAVAAWHVRSPLGICLRRSLLRYFFLRRANMPVSIVFGARLKSAAEGEGLGGHAWLTLDGVPYYENPADYKGFVIMYVYPPADGKP